jgi:mono/diheme cytochrome c family protein
MSQPLRMPLLERGRISESLCGIRVALSMSVVLAVLSLAYSAAYSAGAAETDASDLPQAGRDIIRAPESVAAGQRLFGLNCTYCHGSKGIGGRGKPLQCRDDLTAATVFETITNGRNAPGFIMPSWKSSVAEPDRWRLAAYVLSLRNLPSCK